MSLSRKLPVAPVFLVLGILALSHGGMAAPKAGGKPHWSLQPLRMSAEGEVWSKEWKEGRGANPVDRFVDAKLAANGLKRSPEANPRTLIRRLSFDLTGLPPTPDEIA